jgi:CHASE2 domain-containing sensor protein
MSLDALASNQFALVISQAAAPAFLLGAVASFLSVLFSHLNRIVDRSRAISSLADEDPTSAKLKATMPQLKIRATHVGRAIYWALGSAVATCFVIVAAFGAVLFGFRHEFGAAILFTISLGLLIASLISFGHAIKLSLSQAVLD